ncbi:MAG TPA: YciI family protein [Polyangiaceae bacterium]|nr:YciI family protein [Polyangiaceae bacterium]
MSQFVFLYREARTPAPQELKRRMEKTLAWFEDLQKKGHLAVYGHPLNRSDGRVVRKGEVTDGPYAETKDIVIGFSVIEAKDLDEAVRLAGACPLVEAGCLVEVRPVLAL